VRFMHEWREMVAARHASRYFRNARRRASRSRKEYREKITAELYSHPRSFLCPSLSLSFSLSLFLSSLFLVGIKSGSGKVGGIFRAETETIPSDRKMICTERKAAPFRLKISYIFNMSRAR